MHQPCASSSYFALKSMCTTSWLALKKRACSWKHIGQCESAGYCCRNTSIDYTCDGELGDVLFEEYNS